MWLSNNIRLTRDRLPRSFQIACRRQYTLDGRQRLSEYWIPSTKGSNPDPKKDDAHVLLSKAGFIHQAYSGVFQLLPLGLRVQGKVERLIDHLMRSLGASKLALSSLSTEGLWRRSGRLSDASELLKVRTRAKDAFLLSPTHEEEITKLVSSTISSPKDLPLRLYQVTRKYRDEKRPRQGLLRTREFMMKDLYTFDIDEAKAVETYAAVKAAYTTLFERLRVPFLVADANSGNMGGTRSHEFHFPSPYGEDTVFSCDSCVYIANEELATAYRPPNFADIDAPLKRWLGIQSDGRTLVIIYYRSSSKKPADIDINLHALKRVIPSIDTGVEQPLQRWLSNIRSYLAHQPGQETAQDKEEERDRGEETEAPFTIFPLYDSLSIPEPPATPPSVTFQKTLDAVSYEASTLGHKKFHISTIDPPLNCGTDLVRVRHGDICPSCQTGRLQSTHAIELGHTFYLGTRYSDPLSAVVNPPGGVNAAGSAAPVPVSMGCHGIGISRMIGAMAAIMRDDTGLNWPRAVAPFEVVIIPGARIEDEHIRHAYDLIAGGDGEGIDAVIDDREGTLIQKLKDADLIGYPVIVALGRDWESGRRVELQCRRLGLKTTVTLEEVTGMVGNCLRQLDERAA